MRLRQIAFVARDLPTTRRQLQALLGLQAPYRDAGVGAFGLDNAVFVFGDQFIEIVSPLRDGTAGGRALQRRGDSGYMLLLQTDDLRRDRERFRALGVREIWSAEHDDIAAVHLHPKDIGGAIVSVDRPLPAASWRWGGPGWRMQDGRRGAQRIVGVTLEADDPRAMSRRWAEVFDLAAPRERDGSFALALRDAELRFVEAGARGEGIAAFSLRVADLPQVLTRARELGLPADGAQVTLMGARLELLQLPPAAA